MNKKFLAMALALVLLIGGAVSGSLAWLTDETDAVTNTFTESNIAITLEETKTEFKMIPGWDIEKDPKVTVESDSEDCYVFVVIEKSKNFDEYLTYAVAEGWTKLENASGVISTQSVYYKVFATVDGTTTNEKGKEYSVLKDDKVTVKSDVTSAQMSAITGENAAKPLLTFTAYAVQYWTANGQTWTDAAAAWAEASK
ncbi:MAG: hypothetical protein IJ302_06015 [Clostridia bacterium]|nr:hypothetical protein [Clostridia bacterium]